MKRTLNLALAAMLCAAPISFAAVIPEYTVERSSGKIVIDGILDDAAWTAAKPFPPFVFPWWKSGDREATEVKMLWDDTFLYIAYRCDDAHIWADHYDSNSATCLDDCVDIFWNPNPASGESYNMFEMNCIGNLLSVFNSGDKSIFQNEIMPPHMAQSIRGTVNNDADADTTWVLEIAIRFDEYPELTTRTPKAGDAWRVGLNRCGGKTNPQSSQWSPSQTPKSNFHRPQDFGRIIFSDLPVRKRR